jgi:hypothetical protein
VFSLQPGFLLSAGIFCFGLWPVFRFGLHFRRRQPFASYRASLLLRIVNEPRAISIHRGNQTTPAKLNLMRTKPENRRINAASSCRESKLFFTDEHSRPTGRTRFFSRAAA